MRINSPAFLAASLAFLLALRRGRDLTRLRAAGRAKQHPAEAARHGEAAYGGGGEPACRRSRPRHVAQRRQRRRRGIATQMVLNVVEPQSSGIGGGAFILTWDAATKTLSNFDGRETAPAAATPELFLDADGKPLPSQSRHRERPIGRRARRARRAEARPRPIRQAALGRAVRPGHCARPRRLPRLAASCRAARGVRSRKLRARRARLFLRCRRQTLAGRLQADQSRRSPTPSRRSPRTVPQPSTRAASRMTSPPPCRTIRAGPASSPPRISRSYRAKLREPVCVPYRVFQVCGAAPPSSGAVTVGQVLGSDRALRSRHDAARSAARASHRRGRAPRLRRPRPLSRRSGFRDRAAGRPARPILSRSAPRPDRSQPRAGRSDRRHAAQHASGRLRPRRDHRECRHEPHLHRRRRWQRRLHDHHHRAGLRLPFDGARLPAQQSAHRFLLHPRR